MKTIREQMDGLKADMTAIINRSKAAGRDLTTAEAADIEAKADAYEQLKAQAEQGQKVADVVERLAVAQSTPTVATGESWGKSVHERLTGAAAARGLKSVLQGQISTPPAVEVSALPTTPTRLLDLIAREELESATFDFLRQVARDENADVVADGDTKPTSVYTFEEINDRARVIAHLSEPFPERFLEDHSSMVQVLDQQMRTGVLRKLEQQVVDGDGTGEQFTGILNTSGVTDVAFATDQLTTIRRARTVLGGLGEAPTGWVLNPTDAEALDLLREDGATGGFLMNSSVYDGLFGQGVARITSTAVPQGTALLADWSQVRVGVRQSDHTLAATQAGDLFDKNQVKLRAEGRYGLKLFRPQAFAVVHLAAA
ncbi:HK97 family phage major capsid protein [Georgenia soli]|uniref:HK97 family phage major capsid protein n=2 Tax=Georgenia soli TaxID=638953 RepID=A0A2A9ENW6_9MICO|nr:HK97 family phage major capsid protein [Georgenia soli]